MSMKCVGVGSLNHKNQQRIQFLTPRTKDIHSQVP